MWSPNQSIVQRFEACVRESPAAVAVATAAGRWTYDRLNRESDRLANALLDRRGPATEPVLLLFPQGALPIAAVLGALKAGKIYVPLDPAFPLARNQFIASDSGSQVLLTTADHLAQAEALSSGRLQVIDVEHLSDDGLDDDPGLTVSPDSGAFILYTSGSTGKPKGVLQTHGNLVHNAWRQTAAMGFTPSDRLTSLYSTSVMGHVRDFYNALLNGAGLWSFDLRAEGVARLAGWLVSEEITVLHTIASVFRHLAPTLPPPEALKHLRLLILGGESVLATDLQIFRSRFPTHTRLFTGLGSTETGTARGILLDQAADVPHAILPLGYPVSGVEVALEDPEGRPVPEGEVGEIVVESPHLALGYWNLPELTDESFGGGAGGQHRFRTGDLGRMLPDGCLLYAERKDFQVKIRGYRIETAEVEAAILQTGLAADTVVVGHEARPGTTVLVAYLAGPEPTPIDRLRTALAERLPDYMVPAVFMQLEALPLTPNGKVAREALPAPILDRWTSAPPRDDIEIELVRLWQDLLSLDAIGIEEDFFEIGGDSLAASLMALDIERRFDVEFPLSLFIERRTVARIAAWLRERGEAPGCLIPIQPSGAAPPLFVVPGGYGNVLFLRHLARQLGADQPLFALQSTRSATGLRQYYRDVDEVAGTYLEEIRRARPEGPFFLAGYSFGGYVALEMAHRLLAEGEAVGLLVMLDTYPPGPRRNAPLLTRARIHADNLRRIPWIGWPGYFGDRARSLALRSTRSETVRRMMRLVGYVPHEPMVASRIARYGYNPPPYPRRLVVIRARQRAEYVRWDPMERWPLYVSGQLEFLDVDGSHGDILHEQHVHEVAAHLRALLNDAQL